MRSSCPSIHVHSRLNLHRTRGSARCQSAFSALTTSCPKATKSSSAAAGREATVENVENVGLDATELRRARGTRAKGALEPFANERPEPGALLVVAVGTVKR